MLAFGSAGAGAGAGSAAGDDDGVAYDNLDMLCACFILCRAADLPASQASAAGGSSAQQQRKLVLVEGTCLSDACGSPPQQRVLCMQSFRTRRRTSTAPSFCASSRACWVLASECLLWTTWGAAELAECRVGPLACRFLVVFIVSDHHEKSSELDTVFDREILENRLVARIRSFTLSIAPPSLSSLSCAQLQSH